jgi:hypothetical protein
MRPSRRLMPLPDLLRWPHQPESGNDRRHRAFLNRDQRQLPTGSRPPETAAPLRTAASALDAN